VVTLGGAMTKWKRELIAAGILAFSATPSAALTVKDYVQLRAKPSPSEYIADGYAFGTGEALYWYTQVQDVNDPKGRKMFCFSGKERFTSEIIQRAMKIVVETKKYENDPLSVALLKVLREMYPCSWDR
jgi:hypothetical protein